MAAHPHWDTVLGQTTRDGEGSAPAGQVPGLDATIAAPLPDQGLIHVSGSDAASFLHAQLSNSFEDLPAGKSRLAAWCSPKGRTLALFRVVHVDDGYMILLDRSLVAHTIKRLKLFVLRSDVVLTDYTDDWAALGVAGPEAEQRISEALRNPPVEPESVKAWDDGHVLRLPASEPRFIVLGPAETIVDLWQRLGGATVPGDSEAWHLRLIRDGQPTVTQDTTDAFVPQMLNLEPLGGLSFTKGCYPGQEVVARLHYRGQLKRRVYRLDLPAETPPTPGTTLDDGDSVIVDAARRDDAVEALAVVGVDRANGETLSYDGEPVLLRDLPYTMPAD